jgi:carboxymethylenebutenolidase
MEYLLRADTVSRRRFGALTLGAAAASVLPAGGAAAGVAESEVDIETPDGAADAFFAHPRSGAHAGVLVWPDIFGLRPAFRQIGRRLAELGYAVLVINPFYRARRAPTAPEHADFNDPDTRARLMALKDSLSPATAHTDAIAFVGWLDRQPAVSVQRQLGVIGYCMSGPLMLRTAAAIPDRIGAGASFHGGGLVTDQPDSPHRLVPRLRGRYLFAIAENDDQRQPAAKEVLRAAFARAHLPAEIEVYPGTQHGWCPPDSQVYNRAQAERAWGRLLALFATALTSQGAMERPATPAGTLAADVPP